MIEKPENRIMFDTLAQDVINSIQTQIRAGFNPVVAMRISIAYSYETLLNRLVAEGRITINDNNKRPDRD